MRSEYISKALVPILTLSLLLCTVACGGFFSSKSSTSTPATPSAQVVAVAIIPGSVSLPINGTQQFTVSVTGTTNTAVTWSMTEATGGAVSSTGMYQAPAKAAVYHITATSQADATKSSTAAVTVTAPVPAFSSLPPSGASEAVAYNYAMTAVDPAGTNVTYALTSGPSGAVLAGNTLSWTPTPAQSRVSNSFTVTATSDAGGSSTQTWTCTPNGTVRGKNIDTYWAVNGPQTSPNDLSDPAVWPIAALVPQSDGSLLTLPGVGNVDGTFTIDNVPAGHYWLQLDASDFYWTSTSSFDFGTDFAGQPNSGLITASLYWNVLSGLTPWNSLTDGIFAVVPNEDPLASFQPSTTPLADGDTAFPTQFPDPTVLGESTLMPPISPYQGDVTYLLQTTVDLSNPAIQIIKTDSIGQTTLPSVALVGDVSDVHASMTPLSASQTMDLNIDFGAYNQAETGTNPSAAASGFSGLFWKQPIVTDRAVQNWFAPMALLNFASTTAAVPSTVQDFGTFNYGNDLPVNWPTLYYFDEFGAVAPQGAATAQIIYDIGHVGTAIPSSTQADAPVLSAIQSPTINGLDFFAQQTVGGALTLSWNAPTGLLPATGYRVDLYAVDPATGIVSLTPTSLFTATTTITIPSLALVGGSYVFNVEAQADSLANMETSPRHNGYPQAWADAVSGVVTYTGSATAGPFVPAVKVSAAKMQARQMRRALASRTIQKSVVKH